MLTYGNGNKTESIVIGCLEKEVETMIFCCNDRKVIARVDSGYVPKEGDHVSFDGREEFIVNMVFADYAARELYVVVRPARSCDVTFLQ